MVDTGLVSASTRIAPIGALAMLVAVLATVACATKRPWTGPRLHVAGGVVYGAEGFDLDEAETMAGAELDADGAAGVDARIAYRFHPLVAFELQGQLFDDFEIGVASGSPAEVEIWAATANLKIYNDLTARLEPYVLLGLGFVQAELDDPRAFLQEFNDEGVAGRAGVGLDAWMSNNVVWYVETTALLPFDDLDGLIVYGVTTGLQLAF